MAFKSRSAKKAITSKTALGVAFATSIVTANLTASKVAMFNLPVLGDVAIPAGFLGIGVAFLCSDLLSEIHGKEVAHKVATYSVGALGLSYTLVAASVVMPAAPFYGASEQFSSIMMSSSPIIFASIGTTLVSQNLDVSVFHKIRAVTGNGHKWLRNIGSTATSQAVDTALFIGLGFVALPPLVGGSAVPLAAVPAMIAGQYAVKVGVAALDTPLFYLLSE